MNSNPSEIVRPPIMNPRYKEILLHGEKLLIRLSRDDDLPEIKAVYGPDDIWPFLASYPTVVQELEEALKRAPKESRDDKTRDHDNGSSNRG